MAQPRTIPALLDEHRAGAPTRVAIQDARVVVTYAELAARVAALAHRLADAGVGRGDRVALRLPNSVAFAEAFLAILSCGAAVVAVDPRAPRSETARTLVDADATAVVADADAAGETMDADRVLPFLSSADLLVLRPGAAARPPCADDAALAAYSFTASPRRLVARTHANLWWDAEQLRCSLGLDRDDVVLGVVPFSHAHGLGNGLLAALRAGARLVVRDRFVRRDVLRLLEDERVTVFPTVPFMLRVLAATDVHRTYDLSALRLCLSAGAPLAPAVFAAFHRRFGVRARQLYGLTETGSVTCDVGGEDATTVGRPLAGVEVTVADVRTGADLPHGAIGHVVVRSRAAVGGRERAVRTGDLGRIDGRGRLAITGRTSTFVNVAGNKVDPTEVERALRSHPAVAEARVFAIGGEHADQAVAADVTLTAPVSVEALRAHCRQHLAPYKIPRALSVRSAVASVAQHDC